MFFFFKKKKKQKRQKHRVAVNLKPALLTQGVPDHLGLEREKGSEKGERKKTKMIHSNPQKFNTEISFSKRTSRGAWKDEDTEEMGK